GCQCEFEGNRYPRLKAFARRHAATVDDISAENEEPSGFRNDRIEWLTIVVAEDGFAHPVRLPPRICKVKRCHAGCEIRVGVLHIAIKMSVAVHPLEPQVERWVHLARDC